MVFASCWEYLLDLIAMKLTAAYQSGTRFDITAGKHTVITDQPVEDGGSDAGMSPVELFVGSRRQLRRILCGQVLRAS